MSQYQGIVPGFQPLTGGQTGCSGCGLDLLYVPPVISVATSGGQYYTITGTGQLQDFGHQNNGVVNSSVFFHPVAYQTGTITANTLQYGRVHFKDLTYTDGTCVLWTGALTYPTSGVGQSGIYWESLPGCSGAHDCYWQGAVGIEFPPNLMGPACNLPSSGVWSIMITSNLGLLSFGSVLVGPGVPYPPQWNSLPGVTGFSLRLPPGPGTSSSLDCGGVEYINMALNWIPQGSNLPVLSSTLGTIIHRCNQCIRI